MSNYSFKKMNAKSVLMGVFLVMQLLCIHAQQQVIPLWPAVAPGSEGWTQKEIQYLNDQKQQMIRNVVAPELAVYQPDKAKANGTAVIIAPGGGFRFLSWQTEGTDVAEWLATRGVTAFVLKYRTINTGSTKEEFQQSLVTLYKEISNAGNPGGDISHSPEMSAAAVYGQEDGRQAIRTVRKLASNWSLDTNKIGIMGFSAGGMVTIGTLLQGEKQSRPDFAGAIYTPWSGDSVPKYAPPLFILVAGDDALTSKGSLQMYSAWKTAGRIAELHVYSKGGHGFGMQKRNLPVDTWIDRFGDWLSSQGLMHNPK
jgi:acetyl esterase/lipase